MPALLELSLDNAGKSAQQKIQARIDSYQPDHMLQVNDSNEIGMQITSNAQFIEIPSRRLIQQIGIKRSFWDMPLGSAGHGEAMADGIVEQLNDAGVVSNCASKK